MQSVLELIAHLDLFERVDELARALLGIRSWRFAIPRDCGWSGKQIERFLGRYGVDVWGRNFNSDYLFFRVKLRQANWAEYLMYRRGIPVHSPPFNPRNRLYGIRHSPGSEPREPISHPGRWLDELFSLFS